MKILIVSGFLGAGKTTFIKELLRKTGARAVVMENEYGENNIDARDLKGSGTGEMEILEFMEGCVCCTMKDSFVNSVITVSTGLDPEYLIVEPTGVGKLSNILENLKPVLYEQISLLKPVVVLSPGVYRQNMNEWPELYRDQVAAARIVVFSKSERESPDVIADTEQRIRQINPTASIIREHYSRMPDTWWKALLRDDTEETDKAGKPDGLKESEEQSKPAGFDGERSSIEKSNQLEGTGGEPEPHGNSGRESDKMTSLTLRKAVLQNPAQLAVLLEDCLRGAFGHIARAKGTIPVGSGMLRFDLADRLYAITGSPEEMPQCVFIGTGIDKQKLAERLGTSLGRRHKHLSGKVPARVSGKISGKVSGKISGKVTGRDSGTGAEKIPVRKKVSHLTDIQGFRPVKNK